MATLLVCGQGKLSDEVLGAAILAFFESKGSVPTGISKAALLAWANKQAFGLRRCAQKFRKLAWQAESSYSTKIANAKERLRTAASLPRSNASDADPCPSLSAEFLEGSDDLFQWDRLEGLIAQATAGPPPAEEAKKPANKVKKIEAGQGSNQLKLPKKVAASASAATCLLLD